MEWSSQWWGTCTNTTHLKLGQMAPNYNLPSSKFGLPLNFIFQPKNNAFLAGKEQKRGGHKVAGWDEPLVKEMRSLWHHKGLVFRDASLTFFTLESHMCKRSERWLSGYNDTLLFKNMQWELGHTVLYSRVTSVNPLTSQYRLDKLKYFICSCWCLKRRYFFRG